MSGRRRLLLGLIIAAGIALVIVRFRPSDAPAAPASGTIAAAGYVSSTACAGCHREIWERFARTGMGRSMRPVSAAVLPPSFVGHTFYHEASDRHYTLLERDGKFYQRRHQIGPGGREENVFEREIQYVVGSGNHAKTFLYRTADGRLLELPLAWYAEGGGSWAMNPGYDHPNHPDFRREIPQECMFCHNAYPALPAGADRVGSDPVFPAELPAGIDCQRCHGPGRDHIQAAGGANREQIRKAIVNPSHLSTERQLEICMQCHLETTSARLPNSILRWDRGVFSFRPGEPLSAYAVYFDHAQGSGRDDKFEIASQVYRFRKSACFEKSVGKLTCTTCHDPHERPSAQRAIQACRTCHPSIDRIARHPQGADCTGCHMQKRRTEDVAHVVMTDHFIQRIPPRGDPLAPRRERTETEQDVYQGPVALYYPPKLDPGPDSELYLAVAQVKQFSNLREGTPRLAAIIEKLKPANGLVYFELAKAYDRLGLPADAAHYYEAAVSRAPDFRPARIGLAQAHAKNGSPDRAVEILRLAVEKDPKEAAAWNSLGLAQLQRSAPAEAVVAFRKAVEVRPEYPEAYSNLAGALLQSGDRAGSAEMYRAALRLQPDLTEAHLALGRLAENYPDLQYHFKAALSGRPGDARVHYEYGLALAGADRYREAATEFAEAARLQPTLAEAHASLGDMFAMQNQPALAIPHYRKALSIRPDLESARTGLEMATRQIH